MSSPGVLGYALPADAAGWVAAGTGIALALAAPVVRTWIERVPLRAWVAGCAAAASALSVFWIWYYLRGGPRIIDATSYWLEARAMSHGLLHWPIPSPGASFRGRFLLLDQAGAMGVIFPPGYPAVLALGFLLGAPLAIGPVLAAALVLATAALAWQATGSAPVVRLAALLSALSACLRYHTADTMSHGLAALCLTTAIALAMQAASAQATRTAMLSWAGCGLAAGWLLATRPVSFLALAALGALALLASVARRSASGGCHGQAKLARVCLSGLALLTGAALPAALLAVQQHQVTGHWLASSQSLYYLVSDGPPGCFRYGFGQGVGCLVEHEPYVTSVLPNGHGWRSALVTFGRRLYLHTSDVGNTELLVALAIAGAWFGRRSTRVWLLAAAPVLLMLAYVPFYFDGSYPGGGARLFADAIPAEHVLIAIAASALAARGVGAAAGRVGLAVAITAALTLTGFALRASHQHALLRDREGGLPQYEPGMVAAATGGRGLLFVDGDHGFNLAYDPSVRDPSHGLFVARARGDDRDRLLWENLGRPSAWRFRIDPWSHPPVPASVEPWSPVRSAAGSWRFEFDSEWPPLSQSGGYALQKWFTSEPAPSSRMALALLRTGDGPACVTVELPWPSAGAWNVSLELVLQGPSRLQVELETGRHRQRWAMPELLEPERWGGERLAGGTWRVVLPEQRINAVGRAGRLTVCSHEQWIGLDAAQLVRQD